MTVAEMQEWLKQFPPTAIVLAWDPDAECDVPVTGAVYSEEDKVGFGRTTVSLRTDSDVDPISFRKMHTPPQNRKR